MTNPQVRLLFADSNVFVEDLFIETLLPLWSWTLSLEALIGYARVEQLLSPRMAVTLVGAMLTQATSVSFNLSSTSYPSFCTKQTRASRENSLSRPFVRSLTRGW